MKRERIMKNYKEFLNEVTADMARKKRLLVELSNLVTEIDDDVRNDKMPNKKTTGRAYEIASVVSGEYTKR